MTTYSKLQLHLERHVYKRGKNKGEAPLDGSRRSRDHIRVAKRGDCMVVRMHHTDILRAYPDGHIMIDTDGWSYSTTTRMNLNYGLHKFVGFGSLYMQKVMGLSQPVLNVNGVGYKFYDGIEFDAEGKMLSEAKPFEMRRIDKEESETFTKDLKLSGFKDMFPLLYATATPGPTAVYRMQDKIIDADRAVDWPDIISAYKFESVYNYKAGQREMLERGTAKTCWASIMKECKKGMYVTLKSNITTI